uniref:ATP synthase subunit n=2 Tax=Panagrellus redivivus TaxID=6233 RepID=A0A7E4VHZ4_PANRE
MSPTPFIAIAIKRLAPMLARYHAVKSRQTGNSGSSNSSSLTTFFAYFFAGLSIEAVTLWAKNEEGNKCVDDKKKATNQVRTESSPPDVDNSASKGLTKLYTIDDMEKLTVSRYQY